MHSDKSYNILQKSVNFARDCTNFLKTIFLGKILTKTSILMQNCIEDDMVRRNWQNTVVATRTYSGLKPSISPSNVAQNANPGTVLETACPEDSKTPPTC